MLSVLLMTHAVRVWSEADPSDWMVVERLHRPVVMKVEAEPVESNSIRMFLSVLSPL